MAYFFLMGKKLVSLMLIVLTILAIVPFSASASEGSRLPTQKGSLGPSGISEEELSRRMERADGLVQRRKDLSGIVGVPAIVPTIYLPSNADHYFSIKAGSSVTLDDLFQAGLVSSSPTPGQRATEVLFFSNSPPGEKDSAGATYYFWNGKWMKIGEGAVDSKTVVSAYFVVRQNPSAKESTVEAPKDLIYHGSAPQNSQKRPWFTNFSVIFSKARVYISKSINVRTGNERLLLFSSNGTLQIYDLDLTAGEVKYEIQGGGYLFGIQDSPKGWRQSIESVIEVLDWALARLGQGEEKSRMVALRSQLGKELEKHASDSNAQENSQLVFKEGEGTYSSFYPSGFRGINLKTRWVVGTNGASIEVSPGDVGPASGPAYLYDVSKKEISVVSNSGLSIYTPKENPAEWRQAAAKMLAALTEVEKRAWTPELAKQIRAMRRQIISDFLHLTINFYRIKSR